MSQDNNGTEAIIPDEDLELDLTPDGTETEEELKQKLANAEKAKKQILARARKAELELKGLKEKPPETITEAPKQSDEDGIWEVAEMIREGYTRSDVDFIKKNGGREALKDPNSYASVAMARIMEQRAAEAAASQANGAGGQSDVERKYTEEQLKAMSLKDLEKVLPRA